MLGASLISPTSQMGGFYQSHQLVASIGTTSSTLPRSLPLLLIAITTAATTCILLCVSLVFLFLAKAHHALKDLSLRFRLDKTQRTHLPSQTVPIQQTEGGRLHHRQYFQWMRCQPRHDADEAGQSAGLQTPIISHQCCSAKQPYRLSD